MTLDTYIHVNYVYLSMRIHMRYKHTLKLATSPFIKINTSVALQAPTSFPRRAYMCRETYPETGFFRPFRSHIYTYNVIIAYLYLYV